MRASFVCPACNQTVLAPPSLEGEALDCPKCHAAVERWPAPLPQPVPLVAHPVVQPPPQPPAVWYYCVGGSRRGPLSAPQLKALAESGQLRPTDLVWRDGMREWMEASRVPGLFPEAPAAPPPLPLPAANRDEDDEEERPRRRRRRRRDDEAVEPVAMALLVVGTVFIPLIGLIVGCMGLGSPSKKKRSQAGVLLALAVFMVVLYVISFDRR